MNKAEENAKKKRDYEILFKDSPEYFWVANARMLFEGPMVRFICFNPDDTPKDDQWYPLANIHRIKAYAEKKNQ